MGVSEQSEVCSSKKKKKKKKKKRKGRRSVWKEQYIFTNTKNSKNAEIHANVLKELDQRHEDGSFLFCVDQLRKKFKKCISEC